MRLIGVLVFIGLVFMSCGDFFYIAGGLVDMRITSISDLLIHLYGPDFGVHKVQPLEEQSDRLMQFGAFGPWRMLEHLALERILPLHLASYERVLARAGQRR